MAGCCCCRSRIARAGTGPRSPRARRWSATAIAGPGRGRAGSPLRPRSRRCTRRHRTTRRPTGRCSWSATTTCSGRGRRRWSSSTGPSRWRWRPARTPGWREIARIEADGRLAGYRYLHAAKADLLVRAGRTAEAVASYRAALELTQNEAERAFLTAAMRGRAPATRSSRGSRDRAGSTRAIRQPASSPGPAGGSVRGDAGGSPDRGESRSIGIPGMADWFWQLEACSGVGEIPNRR